ncbi:unnamed protein product, partial [Allacma fusca]
VYTIHTSCVEIVQGVSRQLGKRERGTHQWKSWIDREWTFFLLRRFW